MAAINPEASFDTALVGSRLYVGAAAAQFGESAANEHWPLSVTAAAGDGSGWLRFTTLQADAVQEGWQISAQDGGLSVAEAGADPATGAGSSRLFLKAGGNVGIATTTPKHTLEVNGTLNATDLLKNGTPLISSQWDNVSGGINYAGGNVGIGTTSPTAKLQVVAPGGFPNNVPIVTQSVSTFFGARDRNGNERFAINLDPDGASHVVNLYDRFDGNWHQALTLKLGNVGIGTVPNHRFHVVADRAVGLFESTGVDAFLRLSTAEGLEHRVEITNRPGGVFTVWNSGAGDIFRIDRAGKIFLGTNIAGGIVRLNDDLWFSDPQNGTIEIKNGNESGWGQMIGFFRPPCSLTYKKNVTPLDETEMEQLLCDTLGTRLFHYQYLEDVPERRPHLGLVAEESPAYLLGEEGKSLSPPAYTAMLHGAIKALAQRLASLEKIVQAAEGA